MLYASFNKICKLRKSLCDENGKPLIFKSSSDKAQKAKRLLNEFKNTIEDKILANYEEQDLRVELSQGAGNYPVVWHVCILSEGQKVSKGIYVAICFDKLGRGALIGCGESKSNSQGLDTVHRVKKGITLKIDVDGGSENTKYNNCFLNPKEFYLNERFTQEDDEALLNHIFESIDLSLFNLGKGDEPEGGIRGLVNSSTNDSEAVKPEKLYRLIAARRGQKKFRNALLKAYKNTCAISGCQFEEILEAAHIIPYSESGKVLSVVSNGILLRADLHTLFDLQLLKIHPDSLRIELDPMLEQDSSYAHFQSQKLALPKKKEDHPNREYLREKILGK